METAALVVAMFALLTCAEQQAKELSQRWGKGPLLFRILNFVFCLASVLGFLKIVSMVELPW